MTERRKVALILAISATAVLVSTTLGSRMATLAAMALAGALLLLLRMGTLKRLLVAIILLEMAVPIDQYLGHDEAVAATSTLSGFVVGLGTLATGVLAALLLAERVGGGRAPSGHVRLIPRASVAYLTVVAASTTWALIPLLAANEAFLIGQAILAYFCIFLVLRTRQDVVFGLTLVTTGLVLQSVLVIAAEPSGGSLAIGPIAVTPFFNRAGGSFGSANVLASFVTMSLAPALSLTVMQVERWRRILGAVAVSLGGLTLILTESRGGWVGSFLALTIFGLMAMRNRWLSPRTLAGVAAVGVVTVGFFGTQLLARLAQFDNAAALARFPLNSLAISVIGDNPILGAGANNFAAAMRNHLTVEFSNAWISTVHNKYLLVWAETGLVGFITFFAVMLGIFWAGRLLWTTPGARMAPFGVAIMGSIAGTMAHMLVELFHARVQYQLIWILAALAQAALLVETGARSERLRDAVVQT